MSDDVLVQGRVVQGDDPERLRRALTDAFEYRGDVTIARRTGEDVEGFVYDCRDGMTLESSTVRLLTADGDRVVIPYLEITEVRFTGRDAAAGRSWENWVHRYATQKLAGERAGIESERLD